MTENPNTNKPKLSLGTPALKEVGNWAIQAITAVNNVIWPGSYTNHPGIRSIFELKNSLDDVYKSAT